VILRTLLVCFLFACTTISGGIALTEDEPIAKFVEISKDGKEILYGEGWYIFFQGDKAYFSTSEGLVQATFDATHIHLPGVSLRYTVEGFILHVPDFAGRRFIQVIPESQYIDNRVPKDDTDRETDK
jgi:hypothetical protein